MQVYDISRRALRDLESRGIFRDDGARGRGDYLVVICLARFAKSPRCMRILERYEDEYAAIFRACVCQNVAEDNARWCNLHYVNCYEVWHVVGDVKQPKHDPEHVNEYGKKPSRHVSIKFDDENSDTVTPPELPKEDLEELDRIFPPMFEVKELCILSIGYVATPDNDMVSMHCYAFDAYGVVLLRDDSRYPRGHIGARHPFCEMLWEVREGCDIHRLVAFMQRMSKLGCMVELGIRSVEVMR